jgi:hypothetical protein
MILDSQVFPAALFKMTMTRSLPGRGSRRTSTKKKVINKVRFDDTHNGGLTAGWGETQGKAL